MNVCEYFQTATYQHGRNCCVRYDRHRTAAQDPMTFQSDSNLHQIHVQSFLQDYHLHIWSTVPLELRLEMAVKPSPE